MVSPYRTSSNTVFGGGKEGGKWLSKFSAKTFADWMFTKPGYLPVSVSQIPMAGQNTSSLAFSHLPRGA